ncbi:MAG: hypothetical protein ACR2OV_07660, partial [Hyphomicrobiaceae bacterium]
ATSLAPECNVNEMQSQMWTLMMGAANSFAAACTSAVEANLTMQREALRTWSEAGEEQRDADAEEPSFTAFEFPKQGRSWYRAPYEHPLLAFWDQMLQPWRTFLPGASMFPTPEQASVFGLGPNRVPGFDAMGVALSFAPWTNYWAGAFSNPLWSFQLPENSSTEQYAITERRAMPGFAIAKVRFADDTEVTMTIPLMAPFFATAYLPAQSTGNQDGSK